MQIPLITEKDILANVIHSNYRVLMVLDRMGIKLGFGNKTIAQLTQEYQINTEAFLIILNLFCNNKYMPPAGEQFACIPDFLRYLKNSHRYFMKEKIPAIRENIQHLVRMLQDAKAEVVESFYHQYIEEVTEHIDYENETVFPFVEEMYDAFLHGRDPSLLLKEYDIDIYSEHHDDTEDVLKDLKNILIRHLPQKEEGETRRLVLQQLFELESDLYSHARIEDEVLVPPRQKTGKQNAPVDEAGLNAQQVQIAYFEKEEEQNTNHRAFGDHSERLVAAAGREKQDATQC